MGHLAASARSGNREVVGAPKLLLAFGIIRTWRAVVFSVLSPWVSGSTTPLLMQAVSHIALIEPSSGMSASDTIGYIGCHWQRRSVPE